MQCITDGGEVPEGSDSKVLACFPAPPGCRSRWWWNPFQLLLYFPTTISLRFVNPRPPNSAVDRASPSIRRSPPSSTIETHASRSPLTTCWLSSSPGSRESSHLLLQSYVAQLLTVTHHHHPDLGHPSPSVLICAIPIIEPLPFSDLMDSPRSLAPSTIASYRQHHHHPSHFPNPYHRWILEHHDGPLLFLCHHILARVPPRMLATIQAIISHSEDPLFYLASDQ